MSNGLGGNAFTRNIWSHEALPSTSCDLCTCKVWRCYPQLLRRCITKKKHYWTLTPRLRGLGQTKCCPVPSTSCDLCTSKVWCCYILWLKRRRICKKIHYLTLGSRSHKMLSSTLHIMWPMHQQSLILLHPTVKENMHLQEKTLFDLGHTKCCSVPSTSCNLFNYKFEVATSKSLGRDAFTRKFNIWPWPWGQGHTKCCPVPSTSCDLLSYKVWGCYVLPFKRKYIYKKIH